MSSGRGMTRPGADAVGADAVAAVLLGDRAHERHDAGLHRAVVGHAELAEAGVAGDRHDRAVAALHHPRQHGWVALKVGNRLSWNACCQRSGVRSRKNRPCRSSPTLFTSAAIGPRSASTCCTAARVASTSVRSQCRPWPCRPPPGSRRWSSGLLDVAIEDGHDRAFAGELVHDRAADVGCAAGDHGRTLSVRPRNPSIILPTAGTKCPPAVLWPCRPTGISGPCRWRSSALRGFGKNTCLGAFEAGKALAGQID